MPFIQLTVIIAITMSPKIADPSKSRGETECQRDAATELDHTTDQREETAGVKVRRSREVERRPVETGPVEPPEEFAGTVVDEDPGKGDAARRAGRDRWKARLTRVPNTSDKSAARPRRGMVGQR